MNKEGILGIGFVGILNSSSPQTLNTPHLPPLILNTPRCGMLVYSEYFVLGCWRGFNIRGGLLTLGGWAHTRGEDYSCAK